MNTPAFRIRTIVALSLLLAVAGYGRAQPPGPPAAKTYAVELRYRIYAGRNERLVQFFAMTDYLKSVGFRKAEVPDPDAEAEDPAETRMKGTVTVTSAQDGARLVAKILADPRVKAMLLVPEEVKLPEEPDKPVKVQLGLADKFPPGRQRVLAEQIRFKLARLGFREAVGYDNRGHTRLAGTIPVGELQTLLKDLRWEPSGWLSPAVPFGELPLPLGLVSPVVTVEVVPEPEATPAAKEPPPPPAEGEEYLQKIAPGVRELAGQEGEVKPVRLEVILNHTPEGVDEGWRTALARAAPGMALEGRLGPLLTLTASPKQAPLLAQLPIVSVVRLPRPAWPQVRSTNVGEPGGVEALRASGLDRLHALGRRGKGVRVAVVDGDFRGYEQLIKNKQLPAGTRYVDLTAERNFNLQPDAFPGEAQAVGHGAQCALAALLAAPDADLTLIRIDPAAPHQLQAVARYINGETFLSYGAVQRSDEMIADAERLRQRRDELSIERKANLENFGQDPDSVDQRAAYEKKEAELVAEERGLRDREERFLRLQGDLRGLRGIPIVSSSLVWDSGYPLGGDSPLGRYFDARPFRAAIWFQSAGNTRGQAWSGLFRDVDGNGVMEFLRAQPGQDLWKAELNFLGWRPFDGEPSPELPAKATVRLSIQWREAHDPEFFRGGEDLYLRPLANLRLVVLRQRDPSGKNLPADDFDVVARSQGLPQRLDNQPTAATYEQTVEFTADPAGRYAVRVEGFVPAGTRPVSAPTVPALQTSWEPYTRLFVEVMDPASRLAGRPVFRDHATDVGNLGMPGGARGLITVGAADRTGGRQSYSAGGPPVYAELLAKPDTLAFDGLRLAAGTDGAAFGTSLSTPFAAGQTAVALSAGVARVDVLRALQGHPGKLLRLP